MSVPVELNPRGAARELTRTEELLWTSQRLHRHTPLFNMASVSTFVGPIDPARFAAAVDAVGQASETLRTVFAQSGGDAPRAIVTENHTVPTELIDLDFADLDAWMEHRVNTPLPLATAPWESVLIRHHDESWSWFLNVHHLLCDAAGVANLFQAVAAEYHHQARPITPTSAYHEELERLRNTKRFEKAQAHWREWSDEERRASPAALYIDNPDLATTQGERHHVDLIDGGAPLRARLEDPTFATISPDLGLLVAGATVTSAWIHRLTGDDEFTLGIPFHHRSTPASRSLIGVCMEIVPLRVTIEPDDTFAGLFDKIRDAVMKLVRFAVPGTSPAQSFAAVVNVIGTSFGDFGALPATTRWVHNGHIDPHHPVRVQVYDFTGSGDLNMALDINHGVANADQRRLAPAHLGALVDAFVADPDQAIGSVSIVTAEELSAFAAYNSTGPGGATTTVVEAIRQSLAQTADQVSLRQGTRQLTGAELEAAIAQTATVLAQMGIEPGNRVAIRMRRSIDVVIAIHAVMRCGAAFVPVDPDHPVTRQQQIIDDAQPVAVLDELPAPPNAPALELDRSLPQAPGLDDEAYVMYTSGSTGMPKGVPITHRGLATYVAFAAANYCESSTTPSMALFTALGFDLTITTLMVPLARGGTIVVYDQDAVPALRAIVDDRLVNVLKCTPSHLALLVRLAGPTTPISTLIVGGEQFDSDLANRTLDALGPGTQIFNEYGPTEAVVGCMIHRFDPDSDRGPAVPIGRPAPGVKLYILDRYQQLVPLGASGELYIHSAGLTTGYLNQPDLTRARFGAHAATGQNRLYRTGDLVRMLDANTMTYLGRVDTQIKVRGVRLEPGEVEATLREIPEIDNVVVGLWSPSSQPAVHHCRRCGVPSNVPTVTFDDDGICNNCRHYEALAPQAAAYFRNESDLRAELERARRTSTGDYDVLLMLSGGKDSTYALYQLVELGARVHALTLDNGFIAEEAKANVRRAAADLGISHEFATTDAMNEIFRDSLDRYSNVCNGCYKTIYTLALRRAHELGISTIVTGLSRGQLFETRLTPAQFEEHRFDPDRIDEAVLAARKAYHRTEDAVTRLLDSSLFESDDIFDEVQFLDFYRYVDVELEKMYEFLDKHAPWTRPSDSGRSTNCLINAAGISVHKAEKGFHNYALPYSWDVRLGHKTRDEAMAELDDPVNDSAVTRMLAEVGYTPSNDAVLTAWYVASAPIQSADIRAQLVDRLPEHSIPSAFVAVPDIPLSANGKVRFDDLPAPDRLHRSLGTTRVPPSGPVEKVLAEVWAATLGLETIGVTDDFFDSGGTSLMALEMIVRVSELFAIELPEAEAFQHRTISGLAELVTSLNPANLTPSSAARAKVTDAIPRLADEIPALSRAQQGLVYDSLLEPDRPKYVVTEQYRIEADGDGNPLDLDRLRRAFETTVMRHDPLHTTAVEPRRILDVNEALEWNFSVVDSSSDAAEIVARQSQTPSDLRNGPIIRVHAIRPTDAGSSTDVVVSLHHVACDAASLNIIWQEVAATYDDASLPALDVRYGDHVAWQRSRVTDGDRAYFATTFADAAPVSLPFPRPPSPEADGYLVRDTTLQFEPTTAGSPAAISLAAVAAVLGGGHEDDLVLSMVASTRDHPSTAALVGYFLTTLPLRLDVNATMSGHELITEAQTAMRRSLTKRHVPFADVMRDRDPDSAPLDHVTFVFDDSDDLTLWGRPVARTIIHNTTAVSDLTVFAYQRSDGIRLALEYRGSRLTRAQGETFLTAVETALTDLITDPNTPLTEINLRPDDGVHAGSRLVPARPRPILTSIFDQFHANQTRPAVRCGTNSSTYGELQQLVTAGATALSNAGVRPGHRVGVLLERSTNAIAAMLAVLRVGAAYVPLDPDAPTHRTESLVSEAGLFAVITDESRAGSVSKPIVVDQWPLTQPNQSALPDLDSMAPDQEAYVIFTSGSTGKPKGVSISHSNLTHSTAARIHEYRDPVERYLVVSAFTFDSSVAGIYWTLATGGEIVLPTDAEVGNVDALVSLIDSAAISHLLCVPSLYRALLVRGADRLGSLRDVIVAGEACVPELVAEHFALSAARLHNEYGPTETTVWCTVAHLSIADAAPAIVPIGWPIAGVSLVALDQFGRAVPDGMLGELTVAGPTVSRGYLARRPPAGELDSPFAHIEALHEWAYRTGDQVWFDPVWGFGFAGRVDNQINIGGQRAEPAEIEAALRSHPHVGDCAVVVAESDDRPRLVAFVQPNRDEAPVAADAVQTFARERLPRALVPSTIVTVEQLPRTPHGKIDRRQLSIAAQTVDRQPAASSLPVAPLTSAETAMLSVWRQVLEVPELGPDDDFFSSGGDSLAAVELVVAIQDQLGFEVSIADVIELRTARLMTPTTSSSSPTSSVRVVRAGGTRPPIVLLSPGGGNPLGYVPLAESIDAGHPVWALPTPGADGREAPLYSIEAIASRFVTDLDLRPDDQAIHLLGWSTGGLVAYELACRLLQAGLPVGKVIMIDTLFPGLQSAFLANDRRSRWARIVRQRDLSDAGHEISTMVNKRVKRVERVVRWQIAQRTNRPLAAASVERWLTDAAAVAAQNYRPRKADLELIYVAATESEAAFTTEPWARFIDHTTEVRIAGAHAGPESIMNPGRVDEIGRRLNQLL